MESALPVVNQEAHRPTLIMVRHGSTNFNSPDLASKPERIRGWRDVPLNAEGKKEAERLAKMFSKIPLARIYPSDLSRAADTAKVIQQQQSRSVVITIEKALRPWNLGDLQGKNLDDVRQPMLDLMFKTPEKPAPKGEAFRIFIRRCLSAFSKILEDAKRSASIGPILVLAHTRNQRLMDGWIKAGARGYAVDMQSFKDDEFLKTGEGMVVQWTGRKWEIVDFFTHEKRGFQKGSEKAGE